MVRAAWKRAVAVLLAAAVVLGAPGLRAYEAAAQNFRAAPVRVAPLAGVLGSAGALHLELSASAPSAAPASLSAPVLSAAAPAPAAAVPLAAAPVPAAVPAAGLPASARALAAPAREAAPRSSGAETQSAHGARLFDQAAARADDALPVFAAAADGAEAPESGLKPSAAPAEAPRPEGKTKIPRSMWGLFWGHHILTVFGIEFHGISQPFLVMETLKKSKAMMGIVRNVHMGSMSIVNLLPVGLLIDKTNFRTIFIATSLARAALMGAIPLLFLAGHLSFAVLIAVVAINPIFQSTMIVADDAARKTFLGRDEKLNKEAAATLGKWDSLAGMIMPLAASAVVSALVASFGLGGYAISYAIYSGLLLASVPVYWAMVRDPRDPKEMGVAGFLSFLKGTGTFLWAFAKGLALSPLALARFVVGLFKTKAPVAAGETVGLKERVARVLDQHEATLGFSYILRNKTLGVLMGVGAVEAFLSDAMPMVVLPNYITDAVGRGPHLPVLGSLLATSAGVFGVMLGAEYIGRFISSWRMEGEKGDKLIEKVGHGRFYKMAAASSLLFWLMWAFPALLFPHHFWINLSVVMFVQFAMQLFHAPVGIVMAPVVRNEIPDDKIGRVDSAFNMVDLFFSAGGALLAGFLLDWFGISTAMAIIAGAITLTAVVEWLVPKWIFPDGRRPAKKTP